MRKFLFVAIALLAAGVAVFGWRFLLRPRRLPSVTASSQAAVTNSIRQPTPESAQPAAGDAPPQTPVANAAPAAPPKHLGPSKVDLLTASVPTQWTDGKTVPAGNSKGLADEAGGFGVAPDSDLWLKVRIDGKEGWLHSEEDFRALGLPEDE